MNDVTVATPYLSAEDLAQIVNDYTPNSLLPRSFLPSLNGQFHQVFFIGSMDPESVITYRGQAGLAGIESNDEGLTAHFEWIAQQKPRGIEVKKRGGRMSMSVLESNAQSNGQGYLWMQDKTSYKTPSHLIFIPQNGEHLIDSNDVSNVTIALYSETVRRDLFLHTRKVGDKRITLH